MFHTSDTYEQTLTKKEPRSLANAEVPFLLFLIALFNLF
jgi:hypothetical protein